MSNQAQVNYDYLYKLVLVGDSGVGKTNLQNRFTNNEFNAASRSTIGVQFSTRAIRTNGVTIKAQIWDTAGQERYNAITKAYYRGAVAAMIVYDVTNRSTFLSVPRWIEEMRKHSSPDISIIIVGNKTDLQDKNEVSESDRIDMAATHGVASIEASALNSMNVEEAFTKLVEDVYLKRGKDFSTNIKTDDLLTSTFDKNKKKSCC